MELYGYEIQREKDLSHHGILGQRWGKKNGPPYPLDASDHSASEKKTGWRKSLDKSDRKRLKLTSGQKKAIVIGASVVAAGLIGYGLYKSGALNNISDYVKNGKSVVDIQIGGKDPFASGKIGKSIGEIDLQMVKRINAKNKGTAGGRANCFHTTTSYILNSMFGMNTTALPFNGIDEISGMTGHGRDYRVFNSIFDNLDIRECGKQESMYDMFKTIKNGSTGVIHIRAGANGHYINYEKTLDGVVTIIDPQINSVTDISRYISSGRYSPLRVIDFSNASIKAEAEKTLQYVVGGYK